MLRCTRCEGFIPAELSACPNCSRFVPRGRTGKGFLAVLGAGAAAITLMACYGSPPTRCDPAPDGGQGQGAGCVHEEPDAGTTDAGATDGGSCDAGTTDGGC